MCPQSVVACCDTETGHEVVGNGPDGSLELKWCPKSLDATVQRDADDKIDIQPVDMFIPVRLGDGRIGDVRLLGVILCVPIWL